jgi:N utilization substance protein B
MSLDAENTLRLRLRQADPPVPPYAIDLVEGVVAHRHELDRLISSLAEGWTLARMPAVDRNLLRLGAFELLYRPDVPEGVAVSEAVELASRLSTDESATFVNGVLAGLMERAVQRRAAQEVQRRAAQEAERRAEQDPERTAEASDGLDSSPRVG